MIFERVTGVELWQIDTASRAGMERAYLNSQNLMSEYGGKVDAYFYIPIAKQDRLLHDVDAAELLEQVFVHWNINPPQSGSSCSVSDVIVIINDPPSADFIGRYAFYVDSFGFKYIGRDHVITDIPEVLP